MKSNPQQLTLLSEGFLDLASLFPLPGSSEAKQMTVTSGRQCLKLLSESDQLGSFAKTLLVTSEWDSTVCYLTWKTKATPQGRLLFQLSVSMPATDGTGFGLLPTPTANDAKNATLPEALKAFRPGKSPSLAMEIKNQNHTGKLNPEFVEEMMGYPAGWTQLDGPKHLPPSPKKSKSKIMEIE